MFDYRNENTEMNNTQETMTTEIVPASKKNRKQKRRKHMNVFAKTFCCALIIGAVSGSMIMGSMAMGNTLFGSDSSSESTATLSTTSAALSTVSTSDDADSSDDSDTYTVAEIAEKCTSSVVAITNVGVSETIDMFGQLSEEESESAGSGVIISKTDDELLIVTNYHVIEGSDELTVCFNDSEDAVYEANVKGTDSDNDLAVIAVDLEDISDDVLDSITIATIGDSDDLSVGDQVVAIGNALGYGQSVTSGYVSALNREVATDENTTTTLLQTDAAINPGNSGGALFNMKGELIGINSAKYSDTDVEGMGFAIPMSTAQSIIEELMTETTREKLTSGYGYLGIYGQDVDSTTSETYSIPEGIYVSEVLEGSAAEEAGIQKGDIITSFDGNSISSMSSLKERLQYYEAGETVEVTIERSSNGTYEEKTVEVTLQSSDESESASGSSDSSSNNSSNSTQEQQGNTYSNGGQDGFSSYSGSTGSFFGN